MSNKNNQSIFEKNIQRGIKEKLISLNEERTKITYHAYRNFTTNFKKPEELVRASYFVELVLDYNYSPKRIDFEVIVPRRKPEDRADI
ncbi:MAG: hypothetical protein NZ870_01700, partial [bacterium]|nr:hypothetical protein [bacterium]